MNAVHHHADTWHLVGPQHLPSSSELESQAVVSAIVFLGVL
jgi:hypothetical protein